MIWIDRSLSFQNRIVHFVVWSENEEKQDRFTVHTTPFKKEKKASFFSCLTQKKFLFGWFQ